MRRLIATVAAAGILLSPALTTVAVGGGKSVHMPRRSLPFVDTDSYRTLKVGTEPSGPARRTECDALWSAMPANDKARTTYGAFSTRCYEAPRSESLAR